MVTTHIGVFCTQWICLLEVLIAEKDLELIKVKYVEASIHTLMKPPENKDVCVFITEIEPIPCTEDMSPHQVGFPVFRQYPRTDKLNGLDGIFYSFREFAATVGSSSVRRGVEVSICIFTTR